MISKTCRNPLLPNDKLVELTKEFELFSRLPENMLSAFLFDLTYDIENYTAGNIILSKGDKIERFGILLDGEASGANAIVAGGTICLSDMVKKYTSSATTYQAKTDCQVLWTSVHHYLLISAFVSHYESNLIVENLLKMLAEGKIE